MQQRFLWAAMLSAGLLAACGGGGSDTPPPAPTPGTVSLTGTVAKGLMANAVVTAHAINSDGSIGAALVTTPSSVVTDAQGRYTLSFTSSQVQPYVIKITAQAGTTHLDEVTGQAQALPVGFTMRSLFLPTSAGTVTTSASVTPFSEIAVAAAAKAQGGITAANAAQAVSTVTQLLGFNPSTVNATSVTNAANANEQKLAVLLTAVSQMANSGALGCNATDAGAKAQCVVEALGAAASTSSIQLASGNTDVSAALGAALDTVLAQPSLAGSVSPATMAAVVANLECSGSGCTAAPVGSTGPDPIATAIAAAKSLFTNLKSDWTALFSRGGATSIATGAANAEAWKFRQAMNDVQVPAETLLKDAGVLMMAVDLYNDYKAGREFVPSRGRAPDQTANDGSSNFSTFNAVGCSLYQDSAATVLATAPANAGFIGCRATYFVSRAVTATSVDTTEWRHGFTITPAADGSFDYASRARQRVTSCVGASCTITSNVALQPNAAPSAGKVTPTLDGTYGRITGVAITGTLPGAFEQGGTVLVNDHHTWSLSGTRTIGADNMSSTTFSGNIVSIDADGSSAGTLTVNSGSTTETPIWRDASNNEVSPNAPSAVSPFGGTLSGATLNLKWTTAAAEFEGSFSATDSVWDASGTSLAPTKVTLAGALRNIAAGQASEFLSGSLTATLSGYATYNDTQPESPSNFNTVTLSFTGKVTAPGRPMLELTLATSEKSYEAAPAAVTMQYRSLVNGTPRTVIAVDGARGIDGKMTFTLSEAASNLSLAWTEDATSSELLFGTAVIGVLSKAARGVTFNTGEFMSLDIGL